MTELLTYLERPIAFAASLLIFSGQLTYFISTLKKRVTPSVLSWYGWAFLMTTLLVAQIAEVGWEWNLLSIAACTVGCIAIGTVALAKKNYSIHKRDWLFLGLGIVCTILYIISKDPWITTIYAVLADLIIGIPTLIKAWVDPKSERSAAWIISLLTWSLTLLISFNHDLLYALFPIYLWIYCAFMVWFVFGRKMPNH
ncbi:MAG: hypothetical protein R2780_03330 [Crocinitomicaceae bacterium]|nr:hypothetical protein [Crocinitomicaceae bacterium]